MILRIDRLQTELPPPSDARPRRRRRRPGAAGRQVRRDVDVHELHVPVVQLPQPPGRAAVLRPDREHRGRGVRPHRARRRHDQHDAHRRRRRRARCPTPARRCRATRSTSSPAARARCRQDSIGKPWNGDYVFSTGDLVEDLTHNFFLETGARNNKLKVYEMVDHPAARALTGYLLVRGGVHQVAYARAVENLTGADLMKLFPVAADPDRQDPRVPAAHRARRAPAALPLLARRLPGARRRLQRPAPRDRARSSRSSTTPPEGVAAERPAAAAGRLRARLRARGDRRDRPQAAQGRRACPTSRPASWPTTRTA